MQEVFFTGSDLSAISCIEFLEFYDDSHAMGHIASRKNIGKVWKK